MTWQKIDPSKIVIFHLLQSLLKTFTGFKLVDQSLMFIPPVLMYKKNIVLTIYAYRISGIYVPK